MCGANIPKYILDLPNEVLNSSLGPAITTIASQLEKSARPIAEEHDSPTNNKEPSPDFEQLNTQIDEARSDLSKNNGSGQK